MLGKRDGGNAYGVDGVYVGSPVGFPAGAATTLTKIAEAEQLLRDGVEEMDIVMNIGKFKSGERQYVLNELREIIGMTDKKVKTKVIIETRALSDDEVLRACDLVMESGAILSKRGQDGSPEHWILRRCGRSKNTAVTQLNSRLPAVSGRERILLRLLRWA